MTGNITQTLAEAMAKAHLQLMQADPSVILLGEDVSTSTFGTSKGLSAHISEGHISGGQLLDMPISEAAFVTMALGAAAHGLKPIVEIMFADFLGVCADSIINQVAKYRYLSADRVSLPLVIRISEGASGGGAAMHSQSLHGHFARIPGLVVATPSTAGDAAGLLKTGLMGPDPMLLFEPRHAYDTSFDVDPKLPPVPLAQAQLHGAADDMLIIAVGSAVRTGQVVQDQLSQHSISAGLLDPITIAPLDIPAIATALAPSGRLVIVDECWAGADYLLRAICDSQYHLIRHKPQVFTPAFTPTPYSHAQEANWQLDALKISKEIADAL